MILVDRLSDAPSQRFTLNEPDTGQRIFVNMRYLPTQRRWMMDIEYNNFTVKNIAVVNAVNLLRNFRNVIPFGLTVITVDGFDPSYLQDFERERAKIYLLDSADVAAAEVLLNEV